MQYYHAAGYINATLTFELTSGTARMGLAA